MFPDLVHRHFAGLNATPRKCLGCRTPAEVFKANCSAAATDARNFPGSESRDWVSASTYSAAEALRNHGNLAVAHAANAAFGGTGQKCTAASCLIVHEALHDAFVARLVAAARALTVGHALEQGTQIGPVASEGHLQQNLDYIRIGQEEGAELLCGGERLEGKTPGPYMAPAVFARTRNDMRINREGMFAPITCVIRAGSYDEALAIANDNAFGLMAGIMTRSLARASHFRANRAVMPPNSTPP